jgi:2-amino-4-hydroxy-6-hydroxymethyldihydropteridine diphosphokinase
MTYDQANLKKVFISLGSNLGDRAFYIKKAIKLISENPSIKLIKASRLMETSPLGPIPQGSYLNQILMIFTSMSPPDLLSFLKLIELKLGRKKRKKWAQREIDIDIIAYQGAITRTVELWIPHKETANRLFVLEGLKELEPSYVLEGETETVEQIYKSRVEKLKDQKVKFLVEQKD